jgi:hypothetical protein
MSKATETIDAKGEKEHWRTNASLWHDVANFPLMLVISTG